MNTEKPKSSTLESLADAIERQADREVSEMWAGLHQEVHEFSLKLFDNGSLTEEIHRKFLEYQIPKKIREVTHRVVSSASLSAVEKKSA